MSIILQQDVPFQLRDGTRCVAEVWLPDDGVPHPAVLMRTPYFKEQRTPLAHADPRKAVARGYSMVIVDHRGRGGSEGAFDPFVDDEQDGVDTVAWVADQEWCDGRVVMVGTSYEGVAQWMTAAGHPPALRAIAPTLSSDDNIDIAFSNRVPELATTAIWHVAVLSGAMLDDPLAATRDVEAAITLAPRLAQWLGQPPDSEYWSSRSVVRRRSDMTAPALIVAGWYDFFQQASLRALERSVDNRDRMIIGPWAHDGGGLSHLVGETNVGIRGAGTAVFDWILDFHDAALQERDPELPRVRAYVLGAKKWLDLETWPPPGTQGMTLDLAPGQFTVDPKSPVPTRGGRGVQVFVNGSIGVVDQQPLVGRQDVHVALRHRLEDETLLAGPITARLKTRTQPEPTPPDAKASPATVSLGIDARLWVATLCISRPDGRLHNIAEGVASSSPDDEDVTVELGDTFYLLPADTEIVLLVAGSSFPRWPVPDLGADQAVITGSTISLTTVDTTLLDTEA
ncbi:CocE/NonD family hydrolase [Streptomyces asiaticus]|uniref:CocE/NonD family hydrolase n=1 Tax=Streptomyces asiaticus TaxID=114695 RepID=UPI003F673AD4